MRRPISHALKVVAAGFVLAVAGCAPTGLIYQPAAEVSDEEARSELLAAFEAQYEQPATMELVMGDVMTVRGSVDPLSGAGHVSMSMRDGPMRVNLEFIILPPDLWINLGEAGPMFGVETPWVHIDLAEYTQEALPFMGSDLDSLAAFGSYMIDEGIISVTKVDEVTFEGQLDPVMMNDVLMGAGDLYRSTPASAVPFTAVVDDQGRLVRLSLTIPGAPPGVPDTVEVTYYDYGVPVEVSPPPADEVGPMPEELRELFGAAE